LRLFQGGEDFALLKTPSPSQKVDLGVGSAFSFVLSTLNGLLLSTELLLIEKQVKDLQEFAATPWQ
jgi:hypothetical protein